MQAVSSLLVCHKEGVSYFWEFSIAYRVLHHSPCSWWAWKKRRRKKSITVSKKATKPPCMSFRYPLAFYYAVSLVLAHKLYIRLLASKSYFCMEMQVYSESGDAFWVPRSDDAKHLCAAHTSEAARFILFSTASRPPPLDTCSRLQARKSHGYKMQTEEGNGISFLFNVMWCNIKPEAI